MMRPSRVLGVVAVLFALELARECFVLNVMGFQPGRFVDWVRSDEL